MHYGGCELKKVLFIGRWMPFHEGHKYIIDSFRKNGRKVAIAVRDTPVTKEQPFSTELRIRLIEKALPNVEVFKIPDIDEVVVGRDVGYSIVQVPERIKSISGTKIREHKLIEFNEGNGMCFWFTGLSGAGKTTIAELLGL